VAGKDVHLPASADLPHLPQFPDRLAKRDTVSKLLVD